MSTYAEDLDRVLRYSLSSNTRALISALHQKPEDNLVRSLLADSLADEGHPLSEHLRKTEPARLHVYDFASTSRGPGRKFGDFTPLAQEDGLLVGATHADSSHKWNGANLTVLGVNPASKGSR